MVMDVLDAQIPPHKIKVLVTEDEDDDHEHLVEVLRSIPFFHVHRIKTYDDIDISEVIRRYDPEIVSLDLDIQGRIVAQPLIHFLREEDSTLTIGVLSWHQTIKPYLENIDFFHEKQGFAREPRRVVESFMVGALRTVVSRIAQICDRFMLIPDQQFSVESHWTDFSALSRYVGKLKTLVQIEGDCKLCEPVQHVIEVAERFRQSGTREHLEDLRCEAEKARERISQYAETSRTLISSGSYTSGMGGLIEKARYTDIVFPAECELGQPISLSVQIRLEGGVKQNDDPYQRQDSETILVTVSSSAFDLKEPWLPLTVAERQDSTRAIFTLIPLVAGDQSLSLEFWKGAWRIGYFICASHVQEKQQ